MLNDDLRDYHNILSQADIEESKKPQKDIKSIDFIIEKKIKRWLNIRDVQTREYILVKFKDKIFICDNIPFCSEIDEAQICYLSKVEFDYLSNKLDIKVNEKIMKIINNYFDTYKKNIEIYLIEDELVKYLLYIDENNYKIL